MNGSGDPRQHEYESRVGRYYALSARRAALDAGEAEAAVSRTTLDRRVETVEERLDETMASFDIDDYAAAFRRLDAPSP